MTQLEIANLALRKLGEAKITALNATTPAAQAVSDLYQPTLDELLRAYRWNFARKSAVLEPTWVEMSSVANASGLVSIDTADHGLTTGDRVQVKDTVGSDGLFTVTVITVDVFRLDDSTWSSTVEAGSFHIAPQHTWGYRVAVPSDCLALRTVNGYEANRPHEFYTREGNYIFTDSESLDVTYTQALVGDTDESVFDVIFIQTFACLLAAELAMPVTGAMSRRNDMMALYQEKIDKALMSNVFERRDPNVDRISGTSYETRIYG